MDPAEIALQFGPVLVSKTALNALLPVFSALLGALTTALATYLTATATDNRKRRLDRQEQLRQKTRTALVTILRWLDDMDNVMIHASSSSSAYVGGLIERDDFEHGFPHLTQVPLKDPPPDDRMFLPSSVYPQLNAIWRAYDEFRTASILRQQPGLEIIDMGIAIDEKLKKLHSDVQATYHMSYR